MSRQKRQKRSGQLNAEEYRELFEECHDPMAIIARDGTILDANHAASELFAWPHAEFLGRNILSVYADPEDRARYQEQIERDGFVRDFEVVFVTRDGRRLDCLLTTVVRRAADGSIIGYQGIVRDVTEARRMDRELREYHEQVRSMAAGIVAIEDRERRRIAVDLHAGTDAAVVSLRRAETQLSLAVADRGRGFEPSPEGARQPSGFGLFSISECLSQAGGTFDIESAPGQGTRCVLSVPSSSLEGKENSR